jgi:hypothetical protein
MAIATPLAAAPSDRLVFDVRVRNDGGRRSVFLLYASVGRASHLSCCRRRHDHGDDEHHHLDDAGPTCLDVATGLAGFAAGSGHGQDMRHVAASLGSVRFAARLSGRGPRSPSSAARADQGHAAPAP